MSDVYFTSSYTDSSGGRITKMRQLIKKAGLHNHIRKNDKVAVKVHFGEAGNTAYLRVPYIRAVVEEIIALGGKPFVTDTNTLYTGKRYNAIGHLEAARDNGFTYATCGAPLIIADGIRGLDDTHIDVPGEPLRQARIANAIHQADAMVIVGHLKGHMLFGFGGFLKHLAMGCASAPGKQDLHSDVSPSVNHNACTGCASCVSACLSKAIKLKKNEQGKLVASIKKDTCTGCGECVVVCPERAIPVNWKTAAQPLFKKSAQYALAAMSGKAGKCFFIGAAIDITRDCDCVGWHQSPIVSDVGFFAGSDPVAMDCAAIAMINEQELVPMHQDLGGQDYFAAICGNDYQLLQRQAQSLGVGSMTYNMIKQ